MAPAHRAQPGYGAADITAPWEPVSDEMQRGLELAAFICRMYGEGEVWGEVILSKGEQIRGMWWMEFERKGANDAA